MKFPSFIGASYTSQSPIADTERTVNWYPEQLEVPGGKNQTVLYPSPGFSQFLSTSNVGCRAMFAQGGKAWAAIGANLFEITANQTSTSRGTIAVDGNLAYMVSNGAVGNQLAIASGGNVYYLDLTANTVSQVSGVAATHIGMLDGYFVTFDPVAARIRISPLNDSSGVWDTTQFAQRGLASDPWKAMVIVPPNIWLVGEKTGEIWYDSGASPFPLAAYPGAVFGYGTIAPFSLAALNGRPMWLTQNESGAGQIVRAEGYSPVVISDRSVETAIAGYARTSKITDAEAWTYQDQGHGFYVLRFPAANATWVYDDSTNRWHERMTGAYNVWSPRAHCFAFGQHLTGDATTGKVAMMDVTTASELDGSVIRRIRRAPGITAEHQRLFYDRFELYLESGLGLVTGQGSKPLVMMRTSADGGKTWSSERTASAGAIGAYGTRVFWTRLGAARDRVFEVSVSDPIPWRLIDAFLDVTPEQRRAA